MTVLGGKGVFLRVLLFCPMLIWVYYISIDFLPSTPAIGTWIYHVNCWSAPGQGFIHRSMRHQEEDKETVQSPFRVEEDECLAHGSFTPLSFKNPIFFMLKILKSRLLHSKLTCWAWDQVSLFIESFSHFFLTSLDQKQKQDSLNSWPKQSSTDLYGR